MTNEKQPLTDDPPPKIRGNYLHFVLDQLADVENLSFKKRFGGVAFYLDGLMVGAITGGKFRLKAASTCTGSCDSNKLSVPNIQGSDDVGKYFEVPTDVLQDKIRLKNWVHVAYRAAQQNKN